MKHNKTVDKVAYIYTFIIVLLLLIPSYFTLDMFIKKEKYLTEIKILEWLKPIEYDIYNDKNFKIPIQLRYKVASYDKNHKVIQSTLDNEIKNFNFKLRMNYTHILYQVNLNKNPNNISYLVVGSKIDYSHTLIVVSILTFFILFMIFILSKIFVKDTQSFYEIQQRYANIFFNDTMHELKTPLGIIKINLEFLERLQEKPSKYLKRIRTSLKQMETSYSDVEYYIKNKNVKFTKKRINVSEFVLKRISFFEDISSSKDMEVFNHIDSDLYVFMNEIELQRLIDNNISNAIKYSKKSSKIIITLYKVNNESCSFIVQDFGYGIKDTKNIFNRFKREDKVQGGFGLGLNIVKNICDKNAIVYECKTQVNEGTTFIYHINLDKKKLLDKVENE